MHVCVCERERQTDRHKGSEGDAASRPATLLGEEHDWGILSTVERTFFFFLLRQLRDIFVRKVESKSSSWDEPACRGRTGTGGRLGRHVRVLNLSGRHSWSGIWGRFPWWRHKAGGTHLDTSMGDGGALRLLQPHPVVFKASLYYFLTK